MKAVGRQPRAFTVLTRIQEIAHTAGWMVSHRKAGEDIYAKLSSETAGAGDIATAAKIAKRYAKQLCKVFRDEQLAQNPQLAVAAAVFGVARAGREDEDPGDDPYADVDRDAVEVSDAAQDVASEHTESAEAPAAPVEPRVRRRPGRPKGSKNKPKPEGTQKRRKRGGRR